MTVTLLASGTQLCTVGTEFFLQNINTAGTFTLHTDMQPMVSLDSIELRGYQTILTGGTARPVYYARYDGVQPSDDQIKISVPLSNDLTDSQALRFSMKATASGTGGLRSIPWKILKYG